jgi:hypothetical protein
VSGRFQAKKIPSNLWGEKPYESKQGSRVDKTLSDCIFDPSEFEDFHGLPNDAQALVTPLRFRDLEACMQRAPAYP